MKRIVVLTGPPGSGKTTEANRIEAECKRDGRTCLVFRDEVYSKFTAVKMMMDALASGTDCIVFDGDTVYEKHLGQLDEPPFNVSVDDYVIIRKTMTSSFVRPSTDKLSTECKATFIFEDEILMQDFLGHMSDGGGEYQYMESVETRFDRDARLHAEGKSYDFMEDGPRARHVHFDYHSQNGGEFGPIVKVKWVREDEDAKDEDE